eukprot:g16879.t1
MARIAFAAVLWATTLAPAAAWYRYAQVVPGQVVKDAGNLTMGGKVGTYTVLIQVLNGIAGDLKLLLECCGDAQPLAQEIANEINTNELAGNMEDKIKRLYTNQGQCKEVGGLSLLEQGNPQCQYLYNFQNKEWSEYSSTAFCVPSDVCAVDVAGATKGTKAGYTMVLQILNRQAGDLLYAGEGPLDACNLGMNLANEANHTGYQVTEERFMLGTCEPKPDTGVLYVFKNRFWSSKQSALNITHFDLQMVKQKAKEAEKKKREEEREIEQQKKKAAREVEKAKKDGEAKVKKAAKQAPCSAIDGAGCFCELLHGDHFGADDSVAKKKAEIDAEVAKVKDPFKAVKDSMKVAAEEAKERLANSPHRLEPVADRHEVVRFSEKIKLPEDASSQEVEEIVEQAKAKAEGAVKKAKDAKKKAEQEAEEDGGMEGMEVTGCQLQGKDRDQPSLVVLLKKMGSLSKSALEKAQADAQKAQKKADSEAAAKLKEAQKAAAATAEEAQKSAEAAAAEVTSGIAKAQKSAQAAADEVTQSIAKAEKSAASAADQVQKDVEAGAEKGIKKAKKEAAAAVEQVTSERRLEASILI